MTKNSRKAVERVGIDFGNTIGRIETHRGWEREPFPHAIEMIAHFVAKFGANNVFIVSKANKAMQDLTLVWLEKHNFYAETGFLKENVLFVFEHADKAQVAKRLGLSIFLDDHIKVVRYLAPLPSVHRIFWMYAKPKGIQFVPKRYRCKVAIIQDWSRTMKYIQKIPKKEINK